MPLRGRSHPQRMVLSLLRLGRIQSRLVVLRAKLTVQKVIWFVALMAVATLLALLAAIFLVIGLFKLVAALLALGPVWATPVTFLLFAGLLVAAAGILVFTAQRIFHHRAAAATPEAAAPAKRSDDETRG